MGNHESFLIVLTHGDEDDGAAATLAFACANAALAMNLDTTVFLTGKGIHWAKAEAAAGVTLLNFGNLEDLMASFLKDGGHILLCSTSVTHSAKHLHVDQSLLLRGIKQVTFRSAVGLAKKWGSITF